MTARTKLDAKAAKSERSFYITLSLAVLSGLAIGVVAFGAKHPAAPQVAGPVANAPKPSAADIAPSSSASGADSSTSWSASGAPTAPSTESVPADVPATTNDPNQAPPR